MTEQTGGSRPRHDLIAGRYRLLSRIGSGSMGVVWQAHDERLDRTVAVKQLLPHVGLAESEIAEANQRAMREGRIAARLQHPHAIAVHDVVEHDGQPYLIMEYLPADSLSAALAAHGPLTPEDAARIGTQIAAALAAAHEAGIMHRDVKPDNILLGADGVAKITDFGISRAVGDGTVTGTGMVVGTPAYLAPEVAQSGVADFRSDVFSLGATLYASVEGRPPFGVDENPIALLHRVAAGQIAAPHRSGPLTPVLLWMLRPEPEQRPTMRQATQSLDAVATGQVPAVPPQPTRQLPTTEARRLPADYRRRTLLTGAAVVLLLAAGVLTGILIGTGGQSTAVAGNTSTSSAPPPPSTTTPPTSACVASYQIVNRWPGGYQATITVTNQGAGTLNGWRVRWTLADGQRINQLWNGDLSVRGRMVTVTSLDYNASMTTQQSTTFGLLGGAGRGAEDTPTLSCQSP